MPTNPATPDNPLLAHAGSEIFSITKAAYTHSWLIEAHRGLVRALDNRPTVNRALRAELERQEQKLRAALINLNDAVAVDAEATALRNSRDPRRADIAASASARAAEARAAAQALRDAAPAQAAAP